MSKNFYYLFLLKTNYSPDHIERFSKIVKLFKDKKKVTGIME